MLILCFNNTRIFYNIIAELSCECKDFIGLKGFGNCKKLHRGRKPCYVKQPSGCKDLIDSKTNPGEKASKQACDGLGKYNLLQLFKK